MFSMHIGIVCSVACGWLGDDNESVLFGTLLHHVKKLSCFLVVWKIHLWQIYGGEKGLVVKRSRFPRANQKQPASHFAPQPQPPEEHNPSCKTLPVWWYIVLIIIISFIFINITWSKFIALLWQQLNKGWVLKWKLELRRLKKIKKNEEKREKGSKVGWGCREA